MRFSSTLSVLALASSAVFASASSPSSSSAGASRRHGSIAHHAADGSSSSSSSSSHSRDLAPASFERRISKTDLTAQPPTRRQKQNFQASNTQTDYPSEATQSAWAALADTDPILASQQVLEGNAMVYDTALNAQTYSLNPTNGNQHLPIWQNLGLPFVPIGDATPGTNGGWVNLPAQPGFDLNNTWVQVDNAVLPFYISSGYDPTKIKRAVITWPGKPRDAWKYGSFALTALQAANYNATRYFNIPEDQAPSNDSVLIISPIYLNDDEDLPDGSVAPNYLAFHGSRWQSGYQAVYPKNLNRTITTYDIVDNFTDWLFDQKQFPFLNSVSIVGHSMGGQAAQRYALLKKAKPYDDNMRYWVGNPGSWGWLSEDRPLAANASCADTFDEWGYGLGGNLSKMTRYGRKQVNASKTDVVNRFLSRRVHIALALLDDGPGDTHCEALRQGSTHLGRGSQFIQEIADVTNGVWPEKFTLSYVANTSHQDFEMFEANHSLWHIYQEDFDVRYPDIGNVANPGEVPKKQPGTKAFATPIHKIMAYSLLLGSIACIVLAFCLLPCLFPANTNSWEEAAWENEAKRKLI
ncbi:hypothetical protein OC834_006366 [Tilletia horrida]|uniref:Uncharacterized protein n=1 Tax=Tilletia horrida TaxID=155126 RepID=A0AAN6GF68_9BASI|nr:hypothetical protein OC834_006366 [Tilletia horrida]KAK0530198.1 hypothetical protein OC842_004008 [Tilletia horrida]